MLFSVFVHLIVFKLCLLHFQLLFSNTCQTVTNRVSWLDHLHLYGLSTIVCDTVAIFVYTDQFF